MLTTNGTPLHAVFLGVRPQGRDVAGEAVRACSGRGRACSASERFFLGRADRRATRLVRRVKVGRERRLARRRRAAQPAPSRPATSVGEVGRVRHPGQHPDLVVELHGDDVAAVGLQPRARIGITAAYQRRASARKPGAR